MIIRSYPVTFPAKTTCHAFESHEMEALLDRVRQYSAPHRGQYTLSRSASAGGVATSGTAGTSRGACYREFAPPADLRGYIACTWVRVLDAQQGPAPGPAPGPIIPDGCVDVITYGTAAPHVAGPATEAQRVIAPRLATIVGLRFRPGAARGVLHCSVDALRNADTPLVDVCGQHAAGLIAELAAVRSPAARRDAMERWARARIGAGQIGSHEAADLTVIRAARWLLTDPRVTVTGLGRHLGWSVRRLHREFTARCGYGPKTLQRVLRLQRALVLVRAQGAPGRLSALAAAVGYADQAHMTRDFASLTGSTPAAYLASSTLEVGRWLDADDW